jgi:hypothetical protein
VPLLVGLPVPARCHKAVVAGEVDALLPLSGSGLVEMFVGVARLRGPVGSQSQVPPASSSTRLTPGRSRSRIPRPVVQRRARDAELAAGGNGRFCTGLG